MALTISGITLADVSVVDAMNAREAVTDCSVTSKGDFKGGLTADLQGMEHLMRSQRKTAADLAWRIRQGVIDIAPAAQGDWSACDWCPCKGICGQDEKLPGGEPRVLDRELDSEAAWQALTGQAVDDES